MEQLRRWLKCRGLKLNGKRGDLIARVKSYVASNNDYIRASMKVNGSKLKF